MPLNLVLQSSIEQNSLSPPFPKQMLSIPFPTSFQRHKTPISQLVPPSLNPSPLCSHTSPTPSRRRHPKAYATTTHGLLVSPGWRVGAKHLPHHHIHWGPKERGAEHEMWPDLYFPTTPQILSTRRESCRSVEADRSRAMTLYQFSWVASLHRKDVVRVHAVRQTVQTLLAGEQCDPNPNPRCTDQTLTLVHHSIASLQHWTQQQS